MTASISKSSTKSFLAACPAPSARCPGYRSVPEGSHIIFYVVTDEYVDIIGIPHKSMDIGPDLFQP